MRRSLLGAVAVVVAAGCLDFDRALGTYCGGDCATDSGGLPDAGGDAGDEDAGPRDAGAGDAGPGDAGTTQDAGYDAGCPSPCLVDMHHQAQSLWSVRATSAGDVMAVGRVGTYARHDGGQWSAGQLPPAYQSALYSVVLTPSRTYVGGAFGIYEQVRGQTSWTQTYDSLTGDVQGGFGGDAGVFFGGYPHYVIRAGAADGGWTTDRQLANGYVGALHGAGNAVYAVGSDENLSPTLLRRASGAWTIETPGAGDQYLDIFALSGEEAWAVGELGALAHRSAANWAVATPGVSVTLHGVWGSGPSDVWVVGDQGTVLRFDGGEWAQVSLPGVTPELDLYSVWGAGTTDLYVVADYWPPSGTSYDGGYVFHYRR